MSPSPGFKPAASSLLLSLFFPSPSSIGLPFPAVILPACLLSLSVFLSSPCPSPQPPTLLFLLFHASLWFPPLVHSLAPFIVRAQPRAWLCGSVPLYPTPFPNLCLSTLPQLPPHPTPTPVSLPFPCRWEPCSIRALFLTKEEQ